MLERKEQRVQRSCGSQEQGVSGNTKKGNDFGV